MKLIVDISAEDFEKVKCGRGAVSMMRKAIIHGTPLPEGAEILTKEAYSDLCMRAADVPNFESKEYIEQRLENYNKLLKSGMLDCVKPSVEPERKKGKWIENKWGEETCSECGYIHKAEGTNYCPNCGAKMEVE